jgi:membrane protein
VTRLKALFDLLWKTYQAWADDKAPRLGAALAYYAVFSIAPLLVIVIAICGLVLGGEEAARQRVVAQLQASAGDAAAQAIDSLLVNTSDPKAGRIATIVGAVTLLLGALGVFVQLQDALNTIWKVTPRPGRGIVGILRDRLLSFLIVLGVGLLLLAALVVSAALAAINRFVTPDWLPGSVQLWEVVNGLVSFGFVTLFFAMLYKVLPDVKIGWADVWVGATVTAGLFTAGKFLLGLYLARAGATSAYGAAGSLVLVLLWVYYSSQIFLFGAEFTRVYADCFGRRMEPAENAVSLSQAECERQGMRRAAEARGTIE